MEQLSAPTAINHSLLGQCLNMWEGMPPSAAELGAVLSQPKVRVFAKNSKTSQVFGTWFWDCDSVKNLNDEGWDIYVVLNPTDSNFCGNKPADIDILDQRFILIDYDAIEDNISAEHILSAANRIRFYADSWISLWTGRGFQRWYHAVPSTNKHLAVHHAKYLINVCSESWEHGVSPYALTGPLPKGTKFKFKVDFCTHDLSRLARWPNTINWKTGLRGTVLGYSKWVCDRDNWPLPPPPPPDPKPVNKNLTSLSQLAPHLNHTSSKFLIDGWVGLGRHTAAYATARNLKEIGIDEKTARGLVLAGAANCIRDGKPFPLPEGEARTCVRNAYKS